MGTLQISVSDELRTRLEARAAESGFGSIEGYAEAVLRASAESEVEDEELEQLLVARATDTQPGIEFTPDFAERFRQQIARRRGAGGPTP